MCIKSGKLCCNDPAHQEIEEKYANSKASYRQAPRDYGDDLAEMGRRQTEHYKQRGRHRFGLHYLQNFFFLVHTCGIVKSFHPQFKEEGTISVAELLNAIYPTPGMMIDTISLHTLTNTLLT